MLCGQFGEWKYKHRNRGLWGGYCVEPADKNASRIAEYIASQLKEDELGEQLTMSEPGPFTGGKQQPERGRQTVLTRLTRMRGS